MKRAREIFDRARLARIAGTGRASLPAMKVGIFALAMMGMSAALSGCENQRTKEVANTFAKIADHACACKDTACAEGVVKEIIVFGKANKDTFIAGSESEIKKVTEDAKRAGDCLLATGMNPQRLVDSWREIAPSTK